jgi:predicted small metal-binding protein
LIKIISLIAANLFILYCVIISMKKVPCRESGFDCNYIIEGYTEQELFRNGEKHVFNMHGMKSQEFTPRFNEKLRPLIEDYDRDNVHEGFR